MPVGDARFEWIDAELERRRRDLNVPGAALAVIERGAVVHSVCSGVADVETGRPVASDTRFRIGSVSKSLTAVAIMTLVERGSLTLDDSADDHLSSLRLLPPRSGGPTITLRHLLSHTAGLSDLPTLRRPFRSPIRFADCAAIPSLGRFLGPVVRAEVPAGTKICYSQIGLAIAGQIVEDVSGRPFGEYLADQVFAPLGMTRSSLHLNPSDRSDIATGYRIRGNREMALPAREMVLHGAASMISTPTDLARYAVALVSGGASDVGRVVSPEAMAVTQRPQYRIADGFPAMGLSMVLDQIGPHRTVVLGGMNPGFVAFVVAAPDVGAAAVLTVNANIFPRTAMAVTLGAFMRAVLARLLEVDATSAASVSLDSTDRRSLGDLAGSYKAARGFGTNFFAYQAVAGRARVTIEGGKVVVRGRPSRLRRGLELHPTDDVDPHRFTARWYGPAGADADVIFERDTTGAPIRLHLASQGFGFVTLERQR